MSDSDKIIKAFQDAGKPLRPGEISEKTGIDNKELTKILKGMKEEGKIYSPKKCFYDIQR